MERNKSLLAVSRFDQVRLSASAFRSTKNIFSAAEGFERHSRVSIPKEKFWLEKWLENQLEIPI